MAAVSGIEWTEATWNPVTGCSKISPGCLHCYAERQARRLQAMGLKAYVRGFQVACHAGLLSLPLTWSRPRRIFVCSMSDLFHSQVPDDFIFQVFETMAQASWHNFQVLTKRSDRLAALAPHLPWPSHIWVGVTVESSDYLSRIDHLRQVPATVRFVSLEPLLGPLPTLNLRGLDWVILGGESGPGARPLVREWVTAVRDLCQEFTVPFFFKQWGGVRRRRQGRFLDGQEHSELPLTMHSSQPSYSGNQPSW
uniref:Phage Gp37/Gp68 family protein n=1 Tax=Desulfobacca acetoxidans TaxID=60893 RepID=A0A7C3Z7C4_9BACT